MPKNNRFGDNFPFDDKIPVLVPKFAFGYKIDVLATKFSFWLQNLRFGN